MPLRGVSQTTIRLAPYFQDNMVLQRSTNTVIYGTGPAGKSVYVRFKSEARGYVGPTWKRRIEPSGTWHMALDLTLPVFESKSPSALWISEEGKNRRSFEITNVVLGDVWLVAGWENQGVAATPGEIDESSDKRTVRFSSCGLIQRPGSSEAAGIQSWEFWPDASQYNRFSTLQLRLAHLLALGKFTRMAQAGDVGIVCVRPEELESGLEPQAGSAPNGQTFLPEEWAWVQQKVWEAQTNRWERLIRFKHQGVVTNEPVIVDYDVPSVFPYAAFSPQARPVNRFSFKGAIWPRHPQRMN